jgi:hypothetical protein
LRMSWRDQDFSRFGIGSRSNTERYRFGSLHK